MKRLNHFLLILGLSVFSIVFANETADVTNSVKTQAPSVSEAGPVEVIQSVIIKLNQLATVVAYSPQLASVLVDTEITPLFDFDYIANEVLLVVNASLNEDEIQFFSNALKKNIITTLVAKLAQANSTSLSFISARPIIGNSIVVKLKVNGYSPFGFYIDLLFHQNKDKKWQIFDIVLNNDSLINYYQKVVLIQARRYGIYEMLGKI